MTDPSVGVLMFVAHRAMEQRILAAVCESGFVVTMAQGRIFARIGPDGTRLTELAERAQVTKQTAGFLVDQLVKSGYVERAADPTDARARLIRIAPRGLLAQARAREMQHQIESEWANHLGTHEMARLRRSMHKLRQITDPYAD